MQDQPLEQNGGEAPSIDSLCGLLLILFAKPVGYVVLLMFAALIAARRRAWR